MLRAGTAWVAAWAVCGLLLTGCSESADGKEDATAATVGVVAGVVVDDAIRPVPGARVTAGGGLENVTGADGSFRFTGLDDGVYVLHATKNGYADAVTQVTVSSATPAPLVKLQLLIDAGNLAYAEAQVIEGFVECGLAFPPSYHFAACGTFNVGSIILCSTSGGAICLGNMTGDRYIVVKWFERTPDFLTAEIVWQPTQALGDSLWLLLGSATPEQLEMVSANTHNDTEGPSPLYVTMDATMLAGSGIGRDAYFLSQTFATTSGATGPVFLGAVVQQRFQMFLTSFFGYTPPSDWRFVTAGAPPPPPS